ncbi:MAG TPA: sigma-70 family RNA polymerase sigma factor [Rhizomicrobium sp.]|jgi:RNA polymerase sigma-70 factor (ECF subfamily)|nr:sigma-70 family RNA polymerase sigma factor [Rhizomicrobium sp.]
MDQRRRQFEAQALPHLDAAYNLARWLSRSPSDAEDIVQDAMLRAFRGFDGFRGGDAKPWLLQIVRNCWRDHAGRARKHEPLGENAESLASGEPDPEAQASRRSEARSLESAIGAIPEEFREVLILREIEDMSYREIAAATGAPIGTVMSRLARARALLRERWLAQNEGSTG